MLKINSHLFRLSPILLCLVLLACNHSRQVVPYEVDSDEVYKALPPNDEDSPSGPTFGPDSIAGFIFDYEMTTDKNDIYVFLDNLTVLDVNPKINQALMDFVSDQLGEYGFIPESDTIARPYVADLQAEGLSFDHAVANVIDHIQKEFDSRAELIKTYETPFNAHFQIYPLYFGKDFVTYRLTSYCYTGGAHGMTVSYIFSYDLESGERLTFEDIVKPEGLKDVREEIAAHMAYSYPIYENINTVDQYIDSLNVWLYHFDTAENHTPITLSDFPVSDVALIEAGLVCVYQMYELTPGSDGCPLVVIPYKDIRGCLRRI